MEASPIVLDWDSGRTWAGHWDSVETSPIVVDWDSGCTWEGHWHSGNPTMEASPIIVVIPPWKPAL